MAYKWFLDIQRGVTIPLRTEHLVAVCNNPEKYRMHKKDWNKGDLDTCLRVALTKGFIRVAAGGLSLFFEFSWDDLDAVLFEILRFVHEKKVPLDTPFEAEGWDSAYPAVKKRVVHSAGKIGELMDPEKAEAAFTRTGWRSRDVWESLSEALGGLVTLLEGYDEAKVRARLSKDIGRGSDVDREFKWLVDSDPSPNKQFVDWLSVQVVKGETEYGRIVFDVLQDYLRLSKIKGVLTPLEKDYKRLTYSDVLEITLTHRSIEGNRAKDRRMRSEGRKVVFDEPPLKVIEISTIQAAADLCRDTLFCVKDPEYSKEYLGADGGSFLYMIQHNDKPAALVWSTKSGRSEVKDSNDEFLSAEEVVVIEPALHFLVDTDRVMDLPSYVFQAMSFD